MAPTQSMSEKLEQNLKFSIEEAEKLNNLIFDLGILRDDPQHQIECHADTLPQRFKNLCKKNKELEDFLQPIIERMFTHT